MLTAILASLLTQCPPTGELRLSVIEACPSAVTVRISGCAPAGSTVAQGTVQLPPTLAFASATWTPPFGINGYGVEDAGNRFSFQWLAAISGEAIIGDLTLTPSGLDTGDVLWELFPPGILAAGFQIQPCVPSCAALVEAESVPIAPCIPSPADFAAMLLAGDPGADMDGDGATNGRDIAAYVASVLPP